LDLLLRDQHLVGVVGVLGPLLVGALGGGDRPELGREGEVHDHVHPERPRAVLGERQDLLVVEAAAQEEKSGKDEEGAFSHACHRSSCIISVLMSRFELALYFLGGLVLLALLGHALLLWLSSRLVAERAPDETHRVTCEDGWVLELSRYRGG